MIRANTDCLVPGEDHKDAGISPENHSLLITIRKQPGKRKWEYLRIGFCFCFFKVRQKKGSPSDEAGHLGSLMD